MLDVRQFIQDNYTPYYGDENFLAPPSKKTNELWAKCQNLLLEENRAGGVLDIETEIFSGICSFAPGYIDQENEVIVGLQTDKPLKRIVNPYGGIRMAEQSAKAYGYEINSNKLAHIKEMRKTHNDGVFDAYSKPIKMARHNHLITGLPDAYGRGRIIGDYRRIALYGTDYLILQKQEDLLQLEDTAMSDEVIRLREEISMQIKALKQIAQMA